MLRQVLNKDRANSANDNGGLGAGGKFSLITCPPVARGNFVLARRDEDGTATVLHLGRSVNDSASLNLARIRHLGALMGANEVHVLAAR